MTLKQLGDGRLVLFLQEGHMTAFEEIYRRPIQQGIGVYYTHWNWGPLIFAIIEDLKFKSAPKNIFPAEAGIQNGFITNLDFKDESYLNALQAELLGPRQEMFLQKWATDWKHGARMKILLSQTNFCTVGTLPENATGDSPYPTHYTLGRARCIWPATST